ncbi:hypothetical protein [Methylophaga thiooxydans]|uniref:hypothetical protein n=1 Tax=Methylophaga thiooxydans TaxID=392484 RepID=UPI00068EC977|nr:hypothetical protein [Methylophaga thiooxydans]
MTNWITSNISEIGIYISLATFLLSLATLSFSAFRYVSTRRDAQLQTEFENYHKLIAELVGSKRDASTMKLDSQVAIAFELQKFKRYRPVTVRILSGLRAEWSKDKKNERLINEMDITIRKLSRLTRFVSYFKRS